MVRGASRHLLSLSGLGAFLAIFAQGLTSCGSDGDDQACTPGELKACTLAGQSCEAVQTCNADGSAYGECACPGGGSAGSAGASNGGSGGGSNGGAAGAGGGDNNAAIFPVGFRAFGAPCNTDADCPLGPGGEAPLICITSTSSVEFGAGGPQGGYCSAVCTDEANSSDCRAIDALGGCGLLDDSTGLGYCIGLCLPGGDPNAIKCSADRAQACFQSPTDPDLGACFPVCQSDAACGGGQFCDFGGNTGLSLCVAEERAGGEIGAPCTPETGATDCESGLCVSLVDPVTREDAGSFCSANCTLGLIAGCGFATAEAVGARDAFCLIPQRPAGDLGDAGFCFELCDTDADCAQAGDGWVCVQDLGSDLEGAVGRRGECLPPAFALSDAGVGSDAGN